MASFRQTNKSSSIPLPQTHICRTNSEVNLEEAKRLYEWRNDMMYHRLISGMIRRGKEVGYHPRISQAVNNIIHTQATPVSTPRDTDYCEVTSGSSSSSDGDEWFFYESWEEQDQKQVPLAVSQMRELPRAGSSCSSESACSHMTQSCPTLLTEEERENSRKYEGEYIFEMDL
mmetsp:Transcript_26624/g.56254  ORF Transcript_26624/g.56254 Transcript_26624/m.56254 type:complete len:173 (+) Transcript_26624:331-849(+)